MAWQEVRSQALTAIELMVFFILFADQQMNRIVRHALVAGVLVGWGSMYMRYLFLVIPVRSSVGPQAFISIRQLPLSPWLGNDHYCNDSPALVQGIFVLIVGVGVLSTFFPRRIILWI